eukprot:1157634-Pelagomonas_calceolata.AAC.11
MDSSHTSSSCDCSWYLHSCGWGGKIRTEAGVAYSYSTKHPAAASALSACTANAIRKGQETSQDFYMVATHLTAASAPGVCTAKATREGEEAGHKPGKGKTKLAQVRLFCTEATHSAVATAPGACTAARDAYIQQLGKPTSYQVANWSYTRTPATHPAFVCLNSSEYVHSCKLGGKEVGRQNFGPSDHTACILTPGVTQNWCKQRSGSSQKTLTLAKAGKEELEPLHTHAHPLNALLRGAKGDQSF